MRSLERRCAYICRPAVGQFENGDGRRRWPSHAAPVLQAVDEQARDLFVLECFIVVFGIFIAGFVCFGFVVIGIVFIFDLIFQIAGTIAAQ